MDFLKTFLDEDPEYERIIANAQREASANSPPGSTVAFLDLSHLSDHDKKVVDRQLRRNLERCMQKQMEEEGIEITNSGSAVLLPANEHYILHGNQANYWSVNRPLVSKPQKAGQKPNPYQLMQKLLSVVPLRRYEGIMYRYSDGVFLSVNPNELQELVSYVLEPEIAAGFGPQILSEVTKLVSVYHGIKVFQVTDSKTRFFFRNGALNMQTGALEPVIPEDFFTSYIDCIYPVGETGCPAFEQFLSSVSGGDQLIVQAIWEMIGYLLVPYDLDGKVFFVLQGIGNSGKSVLGSLIASFFNGESVSHLDIFRFKERFATSSLVGKRLNVSMDLPREKLSKEAIGTLKQITGKDTITVEAKFKEARSYKPTCKLLFGTNFPLLVADDDEAFLQRMVVIPFQYPVPEEAQDKHLLDKLMLERPAIAARAIDAYRALVSRNYEFIRPGGATVFGCPPMIDVLLAFLDHCCMMDSSSFSSTLDLHTAFNEFCCREGLPTIKDRVQFSRQLNSLCVGRIKKDKHRMGKKTFNGYVGIRLK